VFSVLDTVQDAIVTSAQYEDASLPLRGGGLRGGSFRIFDQGAAVRLRNYSFVPGVRVTGTVRAGDTTTTAGSSWRGQGRNGIVQLTRDGGATGRLGGRPFRYRGPAPRRRRCRPPGPTGCAPASRRRGARARVFDRATRRIVP
jgi:hypothetical protein